MKRRYRCISGRLKNMKSLTRVSVGAAILIAAGGCSDAIIDEPPHAMENIEGVITRIELDHHPFAPRILIEENPTTGDISPETDGRKVYFSILESSVIEQEVEGHSAIRIGLEDLEAGSRARGWHTGVLEDSYPQQAGAARIVVLHEP
jgi:hypothetical protein